jgi:hypothetical protein
MPEPTGKGRCRGCGKRKTLTGNGMVPQHTITIPVSRSAMRTAGLGRARVSRTCSGSGKPPQGVDDETAV